MRRLTEVDFRQPILPPAWDPRKPPRPGPPAGPGPPPRKTPSRGGFPTPPGGQTPPGKTPPGRPDPPLEGRKTPPGGSETPWERGELPPGGPKTSICYVRTPPGGPKNGGFPTPLLYINPYDTPGDLKKCKKYAFFSTLVSKIFEVGRFFRSILARPIINNGTHLRKV